MVLKAKGDTIATFDMIVFEIYVTNSYFFGTKNKKQPWKVGFIGIKCA